jgi:hypothetical protein
MGFGNLIPQYFYTSITKKDFKWVKSMAEYDIDVLKVLSLATLLWTLFFINLMLPKIVTNNPFVQSVVWSILFIALLIPALVTTLILVAESLKNLKHSRKHKI